MTDAEDIDGNDSTLAGEYALHLLDADARRSFEARLADEPELRALLREWNESFLPLADDVAEVAPPPRMKSRIDATLFDASQTARSRFSLFGLLGGALTAVALAAAVLVFVPLAPPSPTGPVFTASIAAEDQSLVVQARYDTASGTLTLDRVKGAAAPGRALELWLIAEGATAPVSLGLLPDATQGTIAVPAEMVAGLAGGTLAISDEPPGGSPTGQPTGAVLAAGPVSVI